MGNCYPCNKFYKKHRYKDLGYKKEKFKFIIRSPDNFILYGSEKQRVPNNYFSPNCTKRPLHAQRRCNNCKALFYSYTIKEYCSNDCKLSTSLASLPDPILEGYYSY